MVGQLADAGLASLTIVDNAPSAASREAAHAAASRLAPTYLPMDENTGPAGGYAVGMARVLATAADDDWLLVLDDDRLTGSDGTVLQLRDFGAWLLDHGAPVGAVGLVGARFDRRRGRLLRLGNEELGGPVTVDFVAGGQLLMIHAAAARATGVFDPDLFFGFDDLDYCLRLQRKGLGVYAYGPAWLDARRQFDRLDPAVGHAARRESRETAWRRYYGVRNHVLIMRRYSSTPSAILVTLENVVGRPLRDLMKRRPGWVALTVYGVRGSFDAWTGRLGRRVEPTQTPASTTARVQ
jgi:GT2 family glycosyltransferase